MKKLFFMVLLSMPMSLAMAQQPPTPAKTPKFAPPVIKKDTPPPPPPPRVTIKKFKQPVTAKEVAPPPPPKVARVKLTKPGTVRELPPPPPVEPRPVKARTN